MIASRIISQNRIYVGFMLSKNVKKRIARNRKGYPLFHPHTCGMCFSRGYSSRVAPLRCSFCLTPRSGSYHVLIRFRVQRYNIFLTYANFSAEKMQNMLYNIKKEGKKPPFSDVKTIIITQRQAICNPAAEFAALHSHHK